MSISGGDTRPRASAGDDPAERLLARAESVVLATRRAGRERLTVAAEWAWLHEHDPKVAHPLDHWAEIGSARLRVYEYAAAELAVSLQVHPLAALRLMADAIDLQTRLPRTWTAVQELRVEDWVARKIVSKTRDLPEHLAHLVDAQLAEHLGVLPPGRLLALADARVAGADQAAADAKAAQAREQHGVWPTAPVEGAPDTAGLFVRGDAADLARFRAIVNHIADLLADFDNGRPEPDGSESMDRLRARAVGILADPQGAVDFLAGRNPARGKTTLYVHTTLDQLLGLGLQAVARVEGLGAFTRDQLIRLLGHEHVTVRPVIDLADQVAADAYEVSDAMAERVHLIKPADVFPYAPSVARDLDNDHTEAFDDTGPPGQTRPDNLGKLGRRHHRVKTHARGWQVHQLPGHRYLWITPHGRYRVTDLAGTHIPAA